MSIFQKRISYKAAGAIVFVILLFTLGTIYLMLSARGNNEGSATSTSTPAATESASAQEATSSAQQTTDKSSDGVSNGVSGDTPEEESPPIPLPSGNTVTITNNGFSPPSITINAGETVTWVNNDDRSHWPASDPHPVHNTYPGFDPLSGIAAGSSWSFKFDNKGTWIYHDHQFTSRKGTVVVQ